MYSTYMTAERRRAVAQALPLRPRDFFVLLVLAGGELHGYGIMKQVERESRGTVTLEVGSLYRTLDRLLAAGLIEEAGADSAATAATATDSERRRNYRLASFGREVMRAEAARLQEVVRMAQAKGLLRGAGEP
jgi:DNA-binding PadR family transcriptional regulator